MSSQGAALILLLTVSTLVSIAIHSLWRRVMPASVLSAILSAILFVVVAATLDGHFDAFAWIAGLVSLLVTLPVAVMIGAAFKAARE